MKKLSFIIWSLIASFQMQAQSSNLSVSAFETAIDGEKVTLLDVRTPAEYKSGHLKGALLADWTNQAEFITRVNALDKSKPVYTYCLSGARSQAATEWLLRNNFTAYTLAGGINAWKRNGKPVEQAAPVAQMSMQQYLEKIPSGETVLVDISAPWCPPCKKMEPVLAAMEKKSGSRFKLVRIDGDAQTEISKQLNVFSFPTFIVYKKGKPVWRKEGLATQEELEAQL